MESCGILLTTSQNAEAASSNEAVVRSNCITFWAGRLSLDDGNRHTHNAAQLEVYIHGLAHGERRHSTWSLPIVKRALSRAAYAVSKASILLLKHVRFMRHADKFRGQNFAFTVKDFIALACKTQVFFYTDQIRASRRDINGRHFHPDPQDCCACNIL